MQRIRRFISNLAFSVKTVYFPGTRLLFWGIILGWTISSILLFWGSKVTGQLIDQIYTAIKTSAGVYSPDIFYSLVFITILWALLDNADTIVGTILNTLSIQWRYKTQVAYELMTLRKKMELDIAAREEEEYHNLKQRAFEKGSFVVWNLAQGFKNYIRLFTRLIIAVVILGSTNILVGVIVLATTIPQIWIGVMFGERTHNIWTRKDGKLQRIYYYLRDQIGSKPLEINNISESFYSKVRDIHLDTQSLVNKEERRRLMYSFAGDLLSMAGFITAFLLLVHNVLLGFATVGSLIFMRSVIVQLSNSLQAIVEEVAGDYELSMYTTDMRKWLALEPVISRDAGLAYTPETIPDITFRDVSFRYTKTTNDILKKVNLSIKAGERVAIIGNNGAGKSTLIKLILRIYDPTKGQILANETDIKTVKASDWRTYISVLLQEFTIFNFKTREAISAHDTTGPENLERVIKAGDMSTANEFIDTWKETYDEQLGKDFGGKELSKGQSQKLALATALYKNSQILILDEPTSAIDSDSELQIFKNIEASKDHRTIIFVSHDMAVVRNADRIITLEDGKVTESGTHEELLKNKGYYSKVFKAQVEAMTKK